MSDLLPAAKAIEELEPAVQAFAEATGALGPVREFTAWATDLIRYRRAPYQAKLLMSAAEKIKASGLPPSAVEDKLLRAVLEDGAMEDDEDMQERWANLLANAGTAKSARVRAAFPRILSELEPYEAAILDRVAESAPPKDFEKALPLKDGADFPALENLARLGLVRYNDADAPLRDSLDAVLQRKGDQTPLIPTVQITSTELAQAFVQACRAPRSNN